MPPNLPHGAVGDHDVSGNADRGRADFVARRARLRQALVTRLGSLSLAVVILGGLFALMTAGGDGNPSAVGTSSHIGGAITVALGALALGVAAALAMVDVYLLRMAKLTRINAADAPPRGSNLS